MKFRILVCNFYPANFPPSSGGEQRIFYLYSHLSNWFDVTLLTLTYPDRETEVIEHSETFREIRVPKPAVSNPLHWEFDKAGLGAECSGLVVALAGANDSLYRTELERLINNVDVVVHESPFTVPYDRNWGLDGKPRIYASQNIEWRLARQVFSGDMADDAISFVQFLEAKLLDRADLVFATSEEERERFATDYFDIDSRKIYLAPNGFERPSAPQVDTKPTAKAGRRACVFLGSGHPPNVEAAHFIISTLAPEFPELDFLILGSVSKRITLDLPSNCKSLGFVEEFEKNRLLAECVVALNPLFSGAGTNLKMLDYMAEGAAILTTPVGARGIDLADGQNAIVASPEEFVNSLRELSADNKLREKLGAAARDKAYACYSWRTIAGNVRDVIERKLGNQLGRDRSAADTRLRVLVVNDFAVGNATGGGQVRISNLLNALGACNEVTFLSFGDAVESSRRPHRKFGEIVVAKTAEHTLAEAQSSEGEYISVADLVAAEQCLSNKSLIETFSRLVREADVVVFEHCYMAPLAELVPAAKRVVYSSHNVEAVIKTSILSHRRDGSFRAAQAKCFEDSLLARADLVVCVSSSDADYYRERVAGKRCIVVENGVANCPKTVRIPRTEGASAIFVGSSHMPNVDAAKFIVEKLAPKLPDVRFVIVGSVCDAIAYMNMPDNVHAAGVVDEATKSQLFEEASIAINPMFSGGGSSLKVPDFLGAQLPLISTEFGVRGYALVDGTHYVKSDAETFASVLGNLLRDASRQLTIGRNGREYVSNSLTWGALGRRYQEALGELFPGSVRKRLLVVTYRFMEPAPGGAESFLNRVLDGLWKNGNYEIDVAAPEIDTIRNRWHFAGDYEANLPSLLDPQYTRAVHRFALDIEEREATLDRCRSLFSMWAEETVAHARSLTSALDAPCLLGGWNFAETGPGGLQRWTTSRSEILVGTNISEVVIDGYSPTPRRVTVFHDGEQIHSQSVKDDFSFTVRLVERNKDSVVTLVCDSWFGAEDPRLLGVLIKNIFLRRNGVQALIPLTEDFEVAMRRSDSEAWVKSLVRLTDQRPRSSDEIFFSARGPHSATMETWLHAHMAEYDAVLIQGVPFSTSVMAARVAQELGVKYTVLPHFHMEDRYYHWRDFYDIFRASHTTVAAPRCSKEYFFDAINAPATVIPGGGVDLAEFESEHLADALTSFRTMHAGSAPFILVLGRKAAGKNYQLVMQAVKQLRSSGVNLELLMIGPDDDKLAVEPDGVIYYGPQPRSVVLGALQDAVCVVNMSDSESFGIVVLEAWLARRPVVVQRNCLAFGELIDDGVDGFLVESVGDICTAVKKYLQSPELALQHGELGRAKALDYSWESIAGMFDKTLFPSSVSLGSF